MIKHTKKVLPGLILVIFIAFIIRFTHKYLPNNWQKILGEVVIGMAAGLFISNIFGVASIWKDGVRFCFGFVLKLAIVLLGVRISLQQVTSIGGVALLLVIFLIILALTVASYLGHWLKIPKKLAVLIGVGTAVCGNTAISAVAPAIKAKDEEMSFAIAVNTLFGTLAVFLYPLIASYFELNDTFFGFWAGTAVNDTSQVVATGFSYSDTAGQFATTVKLTRNALMGFVIVAIMLFYRFESTEKEQTSLWKRIKLPIFVVLFLCVATLNSIGCFSWLQTNFYSYFDRDLSKDIAFATKFFILMALVGVGLNTKFSSMKEIGFKPLILGFVTAIILSITSFLLIAILNLAP